VSTLPVIAERFEEQPPIIVGHGTSAYAALVFALAGRASGLVLVDGMGGPWTSAAEGIRNMYAHLRRLLDDPAAMAPAPERGLDPRAAHGHPENASRRLWESMWRSVTVPTLVVETPRSPTPSTQRTERIACLGGVTVAVDLPSPEPVGVIRAIAHWAHG
jgi:hypothetical protein